MCYLPTTRVYRLFIIWCPRKWDKTPQRRLLPSHGEQKCVKKKPSNLKRWLVVSLKGLIHPNMVQKDRSDSEKNVNKECKILHP